MIWKCASGGYHSGKDCYEEFGQFMTHTGTKHDVRLVLLPTKEELESFLTEVLGFEPLPVQVDMLLAWMVDSTPEGKDKKAWDTLHRRK